MELMEKALPRFKSNISTHEFGGKFLTGRGVSQNIFITMHYQQGDGQRVTLQICQPAAPFQHPHSYFC
ncbi:hypothetical protein D9M68_1006000 [compost metagenome]